MTAGEAAPQRLVGIGYQGFGNLGDEAILAGIENLLAGSRLQVVTLLGGNRAPITAFEGVERLTSRRVMPNVTALRRLARADALLVTGGGLLHDHWRVVVLRYLTWVIAARLLRRRIVWLGVGVGPLRRTSWRFLTRLTTRLSHLVLVRDAASARLLEEIGGRVDGVIPDPAVFNSVPKPVSDTTNHVKPLGLVVRRTRGGERFESALTDALSGLAAHVSQHEGRPSIVFTFAGERDQSLAARVVAAARERGARDIRLEELPADPTVGMTRLQQCEAMISVRLHGLILAALLDVPFVGIAYDDKVTGILTELDASELAVPLAQVDLALLEAALERARQADVRQRVCQAVEAMRRQQASIVARLEETLA